MEAGLAPVLADVAQAGPDPVPVAAGPGPVLVDAVPAPGLGLVLAEAVPDSVLVEAGPVPVLVEAGPVPVLVDAVQAGPDPVLVAAGPVPVLVDVVLFFAVPDAAVAEPGLDPVFNLSRPGVDPVLVAAGLDPVLVDAVPVTGLGLVLAGAVPDPVLVEAGLVPVLVGAGLVPVPVDAVLLLAVPEGAVAEPGLDPEFDLSRPICSPTPSPASCLSRPTVTSLLFQRKVTGDYQFYTKRLYRLDGRSAAEPGWLTRGHTGTSRGGSEGTAGGT